MLCAIQTHPEMPGPVYLPAALMARQGAMQEGHCRAAERRRANAVAWGWRGVPANGWHRLLVHRVIQRHGRPPWDIMVGRVHRSYDTACVMILGAADRHDHR
jgi:hypothetical protein